MSSLAKKHAVKPQSYLRLLHYVKPYWKQLAVGIAAGILVGSSLFVTLLLIPQLVGAIDSNNVVVREQHKDSSFIRKHAQSKDPKLDAMLNQARGAIERFHLPARIEGREVEILWPVQHRFELVGPNGQMAWQLVALYAAAFVLIWVVKNIAHYINGFFTRYVGAKAVADLREEIFNHLTRQSLRFYSGSDIGKLISRCTNDTSALEYSVSHSVEDLTNAPLQILGCVCAILVACKEYNSYSLAVILFIGVPILVLPMNILGRAIRKIYRKSFARIAEVFSRMHEVFSGIIAVKIYHSEVREQERFHLVNQRYVKQVVRALRLQMLVSPTMELVAVTGTLVFLIYSYRSGVTLTELTALLSPAFMAYRPIKDLSKVVTAIQKSMAAADRFFELLDHDTALPEKADAVEKKTLERGITLEHVDFAYDTERKILSDISFEIPKGHVVAVVGETGSGKSTIANLIARFYDVTSGAVKMDGVDVRDIQVDSLRQLVGVVSQEPVMFNDTIKANIAYGKVEATQEEIEQAARLANAHEFIVSGNHPEGYETIAGENGFRLSGGEKQRIAIARAILRNPPILILDEATSALDTVTEKLVQEALNRVMTNRTVFAIAHRLSTIQNANLILVIKNGHIAESGTHDELLAQNGIYRHLYDTQFQK